MLTATASLNGQVTLPTQIMINLGLKPGDRTIFIKIEMVIMGCSPGRIRLRN